MANLGQPISINNFSGSVTTQARNVPSGVDRLRLSLDGSTMTDPALRVGLTVDYSPDGGATWATSAVSEEDKARCVPFPVVVMFEGGQKDRQGNQLLEYYWESPSLPDSPTRRLRGRLNVSGAPLTTTATLSATQGEQGLAAKAN